MEDERWLMMGVLTHLQKASQRDGMNKDAIMEAIFAISNAYSLNMHNAATKERFSLRGHSMVDIFKAGLSQLTGTPNGASAGPSNSEQTPRQLQAMDVDSVGGSASSGPDAGFIKFLKVLREETAFFQGIDEGSPEFNIRIKRAREKYEAKLASKKQKTQSASGRSSQGPSAEVKGKAEALKADGNVKLKAKKYDEALQLYTQAIKLDDTNAVYYSNRAAAKILLQRYTEAVDDCKRAMLIDPKFVRPREKLAAAYRHLGMRKNEMEVVKNGLKVAPDNEGFKQRLSELQGQVNGEGSRWQAGQGMESMMSQLPTDPGVISSMAQAMGMSLPEGAMEAFTRGGGMEQIASMMRENPNMMQEAMQAMMGGGMGGMGGGPQSGGQGQGQGQGQG